VGNPTCRRRIRGANRRARRSSERREGTGRRRPSVAHGSSMLWVSTMFRMRLRERARAWWLLFFVMLACGGKEQQGDTGSSSTGGNGGAPSTGSGRAGSVESGAAAGNGGGGSNRMGGAAGRGGSSGAGAVDASAGSSGRGGNGGDGGRGGNSGSAGGISGNAGSGRDDAGHEAGVDASSFDSSKDADVGFEDADAGGMDSDGAILNWQCSVTLSGCLCSTVPAPVANNACPPSNCCFIFGVGTPPACACNTVPSDLTCDGLRQALNGRDSVPSCPPP
jgi:hypothetical protein